jgi:hypothetical protein
LTSLLAAGGNSTSSINDVEPGLLGFLVVAVLGLAIVFLLRSMNKQFRKIGPKPEDPEETEAGSASEAPAQRPLRGLAAHRAALAAAARADAAPQAGSPQGDTAEAGARPSSAERD